jgi:ligand-binding sensor domain-containing protein
MKYYHGRFFYAIILTLLSTLSASSQSYVVTNYNSKDGIGHNHIRNITADSSGFIWMATWDGLTRYDGSEFVSYYHDPADSTSIPYFSVNYIMVDSRDDLWLTTDNGILCIFDRATEEFNVISSINEHPLTDLICFAGNPAGEIYFVLKKEVLRYNPATGEVISFPLKETEEEFPNLYFAQYRILFDKEDRIWLSGVDVLEISLTGDGNTSPRQAEIISRNRLERIPGRIGTFFENAGAGRIIHDSKGNVWLAALSGLFKYDSRNSLFREYEGALPAFLLTDSLPAVFYNHDTGLNVIFPGTNAVIYIPGELCNLPTEFFWSDSGMLWLSHQSKGGNPAGLMKIIFIPDEFRHINPFPDRNSELNVFGLVIDNAGALWIAARDRNYIIRINHGGVAEKINILSDEEMSKLWHPRSFLPDSNGVWIGYFFDLLLHYNLTTHTLEENHPGRMVHTMCYDNENRIIIADVDLIRYDPVTRQVTRLCDIGDSINIFTLQRQNNVLWAGCSHSYLLKYDLVEGTHEFLRIARGTTNIEDICIGSDSILWLATLGKGVCRLNLATGEKTFFTTAAGLSNNTTYSLLSDSTGNIWVSTNNGISVINPSSGLIRTFGENDGLMIHEFNSDASLVTDDGKFMFGGVGGAVEFDPEHLLTQQTGGWETGIVIKELEVSALKRNLPIPIYKADTVFLESGDDNFHLSFVVPEYRHPEIIRYRYRLDRGSGNWYYTDHSDRNINFSNLLPGWYNLEIQSTDINGSWSASKKLAIRIKPYFYQTNFFRIGLPLVIIILLYLISSGIFIHIRRQEAQKKDTLRHQALRGQMNPHFIFNALNSINYFISRNDRLSANRYIADFSKLIRTVLNNMNEDSVRLSIEIGALEEYLKIEHLRFGDKFDYSIKIDSQIHPEMIKVSPGLVQPFVENAIWHGVMGLDGLKGNIRISFGMTENRLVCTVEDNGVGMVRSEAMKDKSLPKRPRGIGLAMERMRIINNLQSSNYRIRFSELFPDSEDKGTRVEIDMPVIT